MSDELNIGTPSQETTQVTTQEITPNVENTTQQTEQTTSQQTQEPQKLKVKFNHEEKEITVDEAIQLAQKGMNYDKVQERLKSFESNPALSFVEQQAKTYGLTMEQYIEAVNQQQEQERLNELIQQNIPEEYAREIMANRQFRQEWESQQRQANSKQKQEADILAFYEAFPDVKADELPETFWHEVLGGKPMVDAYRALENQQLKNEIAQLKQSLEIRDKNHANANSSTGSVTGNGTVPADFISKETYESNKGNQSWLNKNYDSLVKSMRKW